MSNPLLEQMLKAGLISEKKIKKEHHAKQNNAKHQVKAKKKDKLLDESKLLALKAEEEKRQRDRELNRQKEDALKQKAIVAQIKQLIEMNKVDLSNGEVVYNFTDSKIVKRLYVNNVQHDQVSRGKLAIVKFGDKYDVVPAIVAKKIQDRDPSYIIVLNDRPEAEEMEDEYADYKIPDDLMW